MSPAPAPYFHPVIRRDIIHRKHMPGGVTLWKADPWDMTPYEERRRRGDPMFDIYGSPCSPNELVDHGSVTILWGQTGCPMDLTGRDDWHDENYRNGQRPGPIPPSTFPERPDWDLRKHPRSPARWAT